MVFQHLLERPGNGALLGIKSAVEVDVVLFFEVPANEGRIGDRLAVIDDVGELALRRLVEAAGIGFVRQSRHLQQHFRLGDEQARIRQAKGGAEIIERDHGAHLIQSATIRCHFSAA
jgi:hypothetical protein